MSKGLDQQSGVRAALRRRESAKWVALLIKFDLIFLHVPQQPANGENLGFN